MNENVIFSCVLFVAWAATDYGTPTCAGIAPLCRTIFLPFGRYFKSHSTAFGKEVAILFISCLLPLVAWSILKLKF